MVGMRGQVWGGFSRVGEERGGDASEADDRECDGR